MKMIKIMKTDVQFSFFEGKVGIVGLQCGKPG